MSKKHIGSTIADFLKEEGIFEETQAQAVKEVVAWQLAEAMKKQKISKNKNGHAAEDEPLTGGPIARPEERHYAREPATGSGDGRATCDDRVGVRSGTQKRASSRTGARLVMPCC